MLRSGEYFWIFALKVGTIVLVSEFPIIPLRKNQLQHLLYVNKIVAVGSTMWSILEYAPSVCEVVLEAPSVCEALLKGIPGGKYYKDRCGGGIGGEAVWEPIGIID